MYYYSYAYVSCVCCHIHYDAYMYNYLLVYHVYVEYNVYQILYCFF